MSRNVGVVIPFYQTDKGILIRSITSVLEQTLFDRITVIIVDDESPVSARDEMTAFENRFSDQIQIIEQKNGGAGSARNTALDNMPDEVEFVAFLDSDDEWKPGHVANAIAALEYGYDFYFSDFFFSDYKDQTAFKRANKITPKDHKLLDSSNNIYEYVGNMHDQIIAKGNVIGTSNVVYRYNKFPALRFREEFYNGQDYLFWLDISDQTDRIVFSNNIECDCGKGINIYAGTGWGTEGSLRRLKNEIMVWTSVERFFDLNQYQKQANKKRLTKLREAIVRDILHRLRHKKPIQNKVLKEIITYDKGVIFQFIPILFSFIFNSQKS
ncbi:MAG: glycosyltransferase family 2 protein [Sedimenticola thiotaurini]|uniref:Glycosyltransferase family 2 protein n=1 Tax=Sedimenticola thiotaurini TaxID=1543721 RepID=A0A558CRI2_9GAMM|nr:MAG: glycosyltransferase family 2 protein [Sedimenticola thiotaurini]